MMAGFEKMFFAVVRCIVMAAMNSTRFQRENLAEDREKMGRAEILPEPSILQLPDC